MVKINNNKVKKKIIRKLKGVIKNKIIMIIYQIVIKKIKKIIKMTQMKQKIIWIKKKNNQVIINANYLLKDLLFLFVIIFMPKG